MARSPFVRGAAPWSGRTPKHVLPALKRKTQRAVGQLGVKDDVENRSDVGKLPSSRSIYSL